MRPTLLTLRINLRTLVVGIVALIHTACGGSAPTVMPKEVIVSETVVATATFLPTPTKVETTPSPTSTPPAIAPPAYPLRAWTVAIDGAVFVLDATYNLYELSPVDLSPLLKSSSLFQEPDDTSTYLLADDDHLFVGSRANDQTLVLNRQDFNQLDTLDGAGPMALDPETQRLFLIPQLTPDMIFNSIFMAYDLADLSQPPLEFELSCLLPLDLVTDPAARLLYVRTQGRCASPPHQHQNIIIYNLDTLAEVGHTPYELGTLSRPAIAIEADFLATTLSAKNDFPFDDKLFILDREGQILKTRRALDGVPVVSTDGSWLYLLRERGLWLIQEADLSLRSILFFDQLPPTDLMLSPGDDTLYLFGNDRIDTYATAKLQTLGIPPISSFPLTWKQTPPNNPLLLSMRLYKSPQVAQDGVAFAQIGSYDDFFVVSEEMFRTTNGGQSWELLPALLDPEIANMQSLSLSPDFANDHTLVAQVWSNLFRSTDRGDTWQAWIPPIAFVSERDGNRELYLMNQDGQEQFRLTNTSSDEENPAWSPAWTRVAFQRNLHGNWDIFSMRADCTPSPTEEEFARQCDVRQLTDNPADDLLPAWSPDGRSIAFVSLRDDNPEIYLMDSNGQNQRRLTFNPTGDWRPAWLPDSQHLIFTSDRSGNNDIYQMAIPSPETHLSGIEPELVPVITGPADDRDPTISGNYLYFLSDRDGMMQVYKQDLRYDYLQPSPSTETDQPEGHPSSIGNSEYLILVTTVQAGVSNIYRASSSEYVPLTSGPTFDGQPAWGPVLWNSIEPLPEAGLALD